MGDDAVTGFQCSWCGICFEGEHGFPVVCFSCGEGFNNKELAKAGLQIATKKEL